MKSSIKFIGIALALALVAVHNDCGARADEATNSLRWAPDLVAAREASIKFKVPLLVHFYGDGCLPCRTFEQRVLSQAEVIGTLNKYFICIAINGSQQPELAAQFGVKSWPTDVFVTADNEPLFQAICPQDAREYMGILTNVALMNHERNRMIAAKSSSASSAESSLSSPTQPDTPTQQASQLYVAQQAPLQTQMVSSPKQQSEPSSQHPSMNGNDVVFGQRRVGTSEPTNAGNPSLPQLASQSQTTNNIAAYQSPFQNAPRSPFQQNSSGLQQAPGMQTHSVGDQRPSISPGGAVEHPGMQAAPMVAMDSRAPALNPTWQVGPNGTQPNAVAHQPVPREIQVGENATVEKSVPTDTRAFAAGNGLLGGNGSLVENNPSAVNSSPLPTGQEISPNPSAPQLTGQFVSTSQRPHEGSFQLVSNKTPSNEPYAAATSDVEVGRLETPPSTESPLLDGYCPVALRGQAWVPGNTSYAVKHRGKVYWMSSQQAADAFVNSPEEYAPVLSGYDPMVLLYEGKLVSGSTQYGLFETQTGQTLLFSSQESKAAFQQSFDKNMQALNAVRERSRVE